MTLALWFQSNETTGTSSFPWKVWERVRELNLARQEIGWAVGKERTMAGGFEDAFSRPGLAFHYDAALSPPDAVRRSGGIRIVGSGDDVNAALGIDPDGQILWLVALTGDFENLLGVCQKAAHEILIGA